MSISFETFSSSAIAAVKEKNKGQIKRVFVQTFGCQQNEADSEKLLGMAVAVAINAFLVFVFLPLGAILPFILTVAVCGYIGTYAAYPKIKEVMIDPYYDENGNPLQNTEESDK